MTELWEIPEARWILFGTLLVFATLVAFYVSSYFRNLALGKNDNNDAEILSGFRELRDRGQLADAEYLKLKRAIPVDGVFESLPKGQKRKVMQATNPAKQYLTLAEAESRKRESNPAIDPGENRHTDDSG